MAKSLSYADAVRMLRDPESRIVDALDRITSGALLGTAVAIPDLLGWLDARAEFARLSRELVARLPQRTKGLARYDRTRRIEAAHAVIVVAAFFESIALPVEFHALKLDKAEQMTVATGSPGTGGRPADLLGAVLNAVPPLPSPQWGHERIQNELARYYGDLSARLLEFIEGLTLWERTSRLQREAFAKALGSGLSVRALARYDELSRRLAIDFPEVRLWRELHEHAATREDLRTGFLALQEALAAVPYGVPPDAQLSTLSRAYRAVLDRPIYDQRGLPEGLRMPTLRTAYVDPCFHVVAESVDEDAVVDQLSRYLADEVSSRDALARFFAVHLTTTKAIRTPLLVLGQPGAGKSVLTKMLAARLPEEGFVPVRVALREVPVEADVQTQIEHAIRATTGEQMSWPQLTRAAGGALPVVLLDGLDELMQVTGASQSDYLDKVQEFQRREAELGRPVVTVVTSRTSVADRARRSDDSIVIELAPFKIDQVQRWVDLWNADNQAYFTSAGLVPLQVTAVMRQPELAGQPLLLLMLALYDAPDNSLLHSSREIGTAELYERLMVTFADREIRKNDASLSDVLVAEEVERELRRLSVAAFAMFNRGRQSITERDLDADLCALLPTEVATGRPVTSPVPLTPAQVMVGRFFFVHEARALKGDTSLRAYEFLHSTFGEYLVARLITNELRQLIDGAEGGAGRPATEVDDRFLHALLSFTPLADVLPVVGFLDARLRIPVDIARRSVAELLSALFRQALDERLASTHGGYSPNRLKVPTRHATYSFNLFLLLVLTSAEPVSVRHVFPDASDPFAEWARHSWLWRACLGTSSWYRILSLLRGWRRCIGEGDDVLVGREDGSPVGLAASASLLWHLGYEVEVSDPSPDVTVEPASSAGLHLRSSSLLLDYDRDLLLDALAPYIERDGGSGLNVILGSETTEARDALAALLATHSDSPDIRRYRVGSPPPPIPPPPPTMRSPLTP